jgi:hypothetical protein
MSILLSAGGEALAASEVRLLHAVPGGTPAQLRAGGGDGPPVDLEGVGFGKATEYREAHRAYDPGMSGESIEALGDLPGADLLVRGVDDLASGRNTIEAALVSMAAPRLRDIGIEVPGDRDDDAGHRLYALLAEDDRAGAHSRYNALVGRIVSLARAAEHARAS